jgi:hypothetical protein
MNDIRNILITALKTSLATATGRKVYGDMPIQLEGTKVFPHISISEVFVQEEGTKIAYIYNANVLIEIVHKQLTTMATMYNDMNNALSVVNNAVPFTLTGGFSVMDCQLNTSTTTTASIGKDLVDVGIIRLIFRIK